MPPCDKQMATAPQYKLIMDGHWTYDADHPTVKEGDNINNKLEVG